MNETGDNAGAALGETRSDSALLRWAIQHRPYVLCSGPSLARATASTVSKPEGL